MEADYVKQIVMQFLVQLPVLFIYFLGIVISLVFFRRHPGVSLLTIAAFGLLGVLNVGFTVLYAFLPRLAEDGDVDMMKVFTIVNVVRSFLFAGALGMVLTAIFWGRRRADVDRGETETDGLIG